MKVCPYKISVDLDIPNSLSGVLCYRKLVPSLVQMKQNQGETFHVLKIYLSDFTTFFEITK